LRRIADTGDDLNHAWLTSGNHALAGCWCCFGLGCQTSEETYDRADQTPDQKQSDDCRCAENNASTTQNLRAN
jgi:hypothetical protein